MATFVLAPGPHLAHAQVTPPQVVLLNLADGSENLLAASEDNAPHNRSAVATVAPYPAFVWRDSADAGLMPPAPSRADIEAYLLHRLHRVFLPYNVVWTARRPATGPYTMVLVGGGPQVLGLDRRVAGVALMDCENRQPSNVVFAFPEALPGNLHGLFVTIAQETGHALGLEHTKDEEDLMNPRLGAAQHSFTDRRNLVQLPRICGPAEQNSHRLLLQRVGAWPAGVPKPLADGTVPDVIAPQVTILSPGLGNAVTSPVVIEVQASDESGLAEVQFQALGQVVRRTTAGANPLRQSFHLPEGPVVLSVWVRDEAHNWGHAQVAVVVQDEAATPGCQISARTTRSSILRDQLAALIFAAFAVWRACRRPRR